jgi:hypothetical protein
MKPILMFTLAVGITIDSTLLWLPLLMCFSLGTNVSFAKMFTNVTTVHMVPKVTFATRFTSVTELPSATLFTSDPLGYIPTKITSFVTTAISRIG